MLFVVYDEKYCTPKLSIYRDKILFSVHCVSIYLVSIYPVCSQTVLDVFRGHYIGQTGGLLKTVHFFDMAVDRIVRYDFVIWFVVSSKQ